MLIIINEYKGSLKGSKLSYHVVTTRFYQSIKKIRIENNSGLEEFNGRKKMEEFFFHLMEEKKSGMSLERHETE